MTSAAAKRYALALIEAADVAQNVDSIDTELKTFVGALEQSEELRNVMENPVFATHERVEVLNALATALNLSKPTQKFLRVVSERERMGEIKDIQTAFATIADGRAGRTIATVESASELSREDQADLKTVLEKKTGQKIELTLSVNPDLIGGFKAQVGSMVFDGTVRAHLDRLHREL